MGHGKWFDAGRAEGCETARILLQEPVEQRALADALENDTLGEVAGGIREHQVQMAGDISYEVGRRGGPTEMQYDLWEDGFFAGFERCIKKGMSVGGRRTP